MPFTRRASVTLSHRSLSSLVAAPLPLQHASSAALYDPECPSLPSPASLAPRPPIQPRHPASCSHVRLHKIDIPARTRPIRPGLVSLSLSECPALVQSRRMATRVVPDKPAAASGTTINIDPASNTVATPSAWSAPGPAAFDLRSDTITTPTAAMLAAVVNTTLLDDVFSEDTTTNALQARVAELTGKEAALLVTSGTMGNQLALRALLPVPPAGVLADSRNHLLSAEAGGASWISGAFVQPVVPANAHHLTLADVQQHAVLDSDIHACPTRVLALENTLAGTILPLADARAISAWARAQSPPLALHLDGARLWDAVAAGAGSLRDYCAPFDTVNLCFSKGLGAPVGSVLAGPARIIAHARHLRKALGGGLRQAGLLAAPARVALEDTFLGGALESSHARARQLAAIWTARGGKLTYPVETSMVWCDLGAAGLDKAAFVAALRAEGLNALGGRLVAHYQICDEAVRRFERAVDTLLGPPA